MFFSPLDLEESAEAAKKEVDEAGEREQREKRENDGGMDRLEVTPIATQEETTAGAEIQEAATNKSK